MKSLFKFIKYVLVPVLLTGGFNHIGAQTDQERIRAFCREDDWKLIYSTHFEIMDKIVNAKTDISALNFNDETVFLNLIQMGRAQYLNKVELVKTASHRLARKYGMEGSCDVCLAGSGNVTQKFQLLAMGYQKDLPRYYEQRTAMIGLADGGAACCGWRFYLCCTVCAGTIAAFPAYLACCALCFDTYCCKP